MEPERDEVYERIPWETLEPAGANRQWLVYVVAAALVLGALAYSFTRNQPAASVPNVSEFASTTTVPDTTPTSAAAPTPAVAVSPVVVAEADLYAVDPERLIDVATAHAEWFALEYVSHDGSQEGAAVLAELLPQGVPLPQAPEGTQVYVDWVRAITVTQGGPTSFDVEVVVRSLLGTEGGEFARQPPQHWVVPIELDGEGLPRVSRPPVLRGPVRGEPTELALQEVPADVVRSLGVEDEVVGGVLGDDGRWLVVIMRTGSDGVTRPVTVEPLASP